MANTVTNLLSQSAAVRSAVAELQDIQELSDAQPRTTSGGVRESNFFLTEQSGSGGFEIAQDELDRYWRLFEGIPMVRESIRSFANEVMQPGYWVELPEDASNPEEGRKKLEYWLENCAIIAGQKHAGFTSLARKAIIQREVRGTALIELATDSSGNLSSFWFIPLTEDLSFQTYPNQPILLDPEPNTNRIDSGQLDSMLQTEDGMYGAYIQEQESGDPVVLSERDVLKLTRDEDVHEILGTSRVESVADRIESLLTKLEANDEAIQSVAFKFWLFKFGSEDDPWPEEDVRDFMSAHSADEFSAGTKQGVTGDVDIDTVSGEVAEIADSLDFDLNWIMTAMPMPRYALGAYESYINQFVARAQETRVELQIKSARNELEDEFNEAIRRKAIEDGIISEDNRRNLELHIETPPEERPRMTVDENGNQVMVGPQQGQGQGTDFTRPPSSSEREAPRNEAIRQGANASDAEGEGSDTNNDTWIHPNPNQSSAAPATFSSQWTHPDEEVAQLDRKPQNASDGDVSRFSRTQRAGVQDLAEAAVRGAQVAQDNAAAYDVDPSHEIEELADWEEGNRVSVDGDKGVILKKKTSPFEWPESDGKVEASEDNPIYIVGLVKNVVGLYEGDDMEETTFDIPDDVDPEKEVSEAELSSVYDELPDGAESEELIDAMNYDGSAGWDSYPPTWEKSEKPARLIFLDMWTSVGASFSGCVRHFTGDVTNPDKFCAATKDEAYGGWTGWR